MKLEIVKPTVSSRVSEIATGFVVSLSAFVSILRRLITSVRRRTVLKLVFPVLAGCLISACALKMNLVNLVPEADETVAALPDEFTGSGDAGSYEPLEWWKSFADPVLDRIIEAALESNFDLAEAVARVEQARAREAHRQGPGISAAPTFAGYYRHGYTH